MRQWVLSVGPISMVLKNVAQSVDEVGLDQAVQILSIAYNVRKTVFLLVMGALLRSRTICIVII